MKANRRVLMVLLSVIVLCLVSLAGVAQDAQQEDCQQVKADLAAARAQITNLQTDLKLANDRIALLEAKLEAGKTLADMLNSLFVPALTGEYDELTDANAANLFLGWHDQVKASDDPLLKEKFQALIDAEFSDELVADLFLYLFTALPKTLE